MLNYVKTHVFMDKLSVLVPNKIDAPTINTLFSYVKFQ